VKIGIDCHNLEGYRTGTARYLVNYKIPEDIPKSQNFQSKILGGRSNALFMHYRLCWAATKDKVDILFCPNYIAPILYRGKIALTLLTLHDIIYEARPDLYDWPSVFDKIF